MSERHNFLKDQNPWGLRTPPAWWLDRLHDFDDQLVVMTSVQRPEYLLCRRWRTAGLTKAETNASDTARCIANRLLPITFIPHDVAWGSWMLDRLRHADLWSLGGADAYEDFIRSREAELEMKRWAAVEGAALDRGASAYNAYKFRTGERVMLTEDIQPASTAPDAPAPSPVSPPAPPPEAAEGVS